MHQRLRASAFWLLAAAFLIVVEAEPLPAASPPLPHVGTLWKRARAHASALRADASVADATSVLRDRFIPLPKAEPEVTAAPAIAAVVPMPPSERPRWRWRNRGVEPDAEVHVTAAPITGKDLLDNLEGDEMTTRGPATTGPPEKFGVVYRAPEKPPEIEGGRVRLWMWGVGWLCYFILAGLFAAFAYKEHNVGSLGNSPDPQRTLENGHFECMTDHQLFYYSCCCPCVRWADTISRAELVGHPDRLEKLTKFPKFWCAFALIAFVGFMSFFSAVALMALLFAFRLKLRQKYGIHGDGVHTFCVDLSFSCCCPCCLISQEARAVDEAAAKHCTKQKHVTMQQKPAQMTGPS